LPQASAYNASKTINPETFGNAYKYDQLNRLIEARSFFNVSLAGNQWQSGGGSPLDYYENFSYDAMGNIQHVNRWGNSGLQMDNMDYRYNTSAVITTLGNLLSNRLYHVNDATNPTNYTDDIDDQGAVFNNVPINPLVTPNVNTANNYGYDELGNLKRDNAEQIANIEWTVYGKIKKITSTNGSPKPNLEFGYDATGQRLWKKVIPANGLNIKTYYYLRDAQGNSMANYTKYTNNANELMLIATEHSMYGSSRLGLDNRIDTLYKSITYNPAWYTNNKCLRNLGLKSYELSNHLGNVLVTVSDKKVYIMGPMGIVFEPEITTINDYYPFGSAMANRGYSSGAYRYGFNGQEKDDEVNGEGNSYEFKYRIHDARLGRFLSKDPISSSFPWNSTYAFAEGRVIQCMEYEGLEAWEATTKWASNSAELFGIYVAKKQNVSSKIKRTCEDLAIGLIADFAKTQGYPLNLKLLHGTQYNAQDKQFNNLAQYKNAAMKNSTAESLRKSGIFKSCGNIKESSLKKPFLFLN